MNNVLSLFPLYNNPNVLIEIKVHDYIIQYNTINFSNPFDNEFSHLFTQLSSVFLCLTNCIRGCQTGLVRTGRCHDIGRVEFCSRNIVFYWILFITVLFSDGRIPKLHV